MDSGSVGWIIVIGIIFGVPMLIPIIAMVLKHQKEMAQIKAPQSDGKLLERIEALEKQCAKLQEQVTDAHALLADERRLLDQKLNAMLPDSSAQPSTETRVREPARIRQN